MLYSESYFWLTFRLESRLVAVAGACESFWLTPDCRVELRSTKIGPGLPACFGLIVIFCGGFGGSFIIGLPPVPFLRWGGGIPVIFA